MRPISRIELLPHKKFRMIPPTFLSKLAKARMSLKGPRLRYVFVMGNFFQAMAGEKRPVDYRNQANFDLSERFRGQEPGVIDATDGAPEFDMIEDAGRFVKRDAFSPGAKLAFHLGFDTVRVKRHFF